MLAPLYAPVSEQFGTAYNTTTTYDSHTILEHASVYCKISREYTTIEETEPFPRLPGLLRKLLWVPERELLYLEAFARDEIPLSLALASQGSRCMYDGRVFSGNLEPSKFRLAKSVVREIIQGTRVPSKQNLWLPAPGGSTIGGAWALAGASVPTRSKTATPLLFLEPLHRLSIDNRVATHGYSNM